MIWDDFFVSIYTVSEAVAVYGLIRMHHVCSLEGLTATYEVESAALRGMGQVAGTTHYHDPWNRCIPTDLAGDSI